jgi:hypothetical protein
LWLFVTGVLLIASPSFGFEVPDLKTPESFIVDSSSGEYYISNINGSPVHRDNNGFIAKLRSDGSIVARTFIKGGAYGIELNVVTSNMFPSAAAPAT